MYCIYELSLQTYNNNYMLTEFCLLIGNRVVAIKKENLLIFD